MKDVNLRPLVTHNLLKAYGGGKPPAAKESGFATLLKESVNKTNELQQTASKAVEQAVLNQETDLHRVMIAQEEASITFELLMEVRNKLLEAYQQIIQMQV